MLAHCFSKMSAWQNIHAFQCLWSSLFCCFFCRLFPLLHLWSDVGCFLRMLLWLSVNCDNGNNASSLLELIFVGTSFSTVKEATNHPNPKSKCYLHRKHSLACSKNIAQEVTTYDNQIFLCFPLNVSFSLSLVCSAMFFVLVWFQQAYWKRMVWRNNTSGERILGFLYLPHRLVECGMVWYSFQVGFRLMWCG